MKKVNILVLEENPEDVALIETALSDVDFIDELYLTSTVDIFKSHFERMRTAVVIVDYKSNSYNGFSILSYCRSISANTPFIFIADTLGEELAVELLKKGATDYLLKARLDRLHRVIQHAYSKYESKEKQKLSELALQESERRLRNLMQISPAGIFTSTVEGSCTYVNKRWSEITGIPYEIAIGKEWFNDIHVEDKESIFKLWQQGADQKKGLFEAECRYFRSDGKVVWVIVRGTPELDHQGNVISYISNITDITALKNAEIKLQEKNRHLEKVKGELDQFVYSASHDLRSPLTSAMGLLHLLKMENNEEQQLSLIPLMEISLESMAHYIKEMAVHSKNSRLAIKLASIDFEETTQSLLDNLRKEAKNHSEVTTEIDILQEENFYTDKFRLNIILKNILSNAFKYQRKDNDAPLVKMNVRVDEEKSEIYIMDNGQGIEAKCMDRVFDMFYRANEENSGSGLGLYLAKEAAEKIGAKIHMKSTLGTGTTFSISIPNLQKKPILAIS